ncbi:MAG: DUF4245 domain-containing protein, partial [Cryobacterium sp.]|nr:DUF4245 domain-containing protein [Cryobacterium sp.]
SWYIGRITEKTEFIGLTQALGANPSWLADELKDAPVAGTVTIAGVTWDVYRNTAPENDRGNFESALVTSAGASTYLLVGTADDEELAVLAEVLAEQIISNNAEEQ